VGLESAAVTVHVKNHAPDPPVQLYSRQVSRHMAGRFELTGLMVVLQRLRQLRPLSSALATRSTRYTAWRAVHHELPVSTRESVFQTSEVADTPAVA